MAVRIGVVGGLDRHESLFVAACARAGHEVDCHNGAMTGPSSMSLARLVQRADLVVLVMSVNSHSAVRVAKRLARRLGKQTLVVKRFGVARLAVLLDALEMKERRQQDVRQAAAQEGVR